MRIFFDVIIEGINCYKSGEEQIFVIARFEGYNSHLDSIK